MVTLNKHIVAWVWMVAILFVVIIQIPVTPIVGDNFQIMFIWGVTLVFSAYVALTVNLWMGLFLLLVAVSAHYPISTQYSFEARMMVLFGVLWYYLSFRILKNERYQKWALNLLCVIGIANAVFLIFQYFGIDPIHHRIEPRWSTTPNYCVGFMARSSGASMMLALSFIAFLRKKWCWFLPLIGIGFIIAHTFVGPLAVAVALFVYCLWSMRGLIRKTAVGVAFALLLASYAIFIDRPDTTWRWTIWKSALFEMYPQHWIMGNGIGHWQITYANPQITKRTYLHRAAQAHSDPIQGLFEMGIFFPVIVCGYFINIYRRYRPEALYSLLAFIIIGVCSLVFFPFHVVPLAMVSLTWMALLQVKLAKNN